MSEEFMRKGIHDMLDKRIDAAVFRIQARTMAFNEHILNELADLKCEVNRMHENMTPLRADMSNISRNIAFIMMILWLVIPAMSMEVTGHE